MTSHLRSRCGFTLIELMIGVVIVGILAALAIPRFMAANVRTRQSEPKEILRQIYTMQRAYRQEYDSYFGNALVGSATTPQVYERISVEIMQSSLYTYTMVAGANTFMCVATCGILDEDATADTWVINDRGTLAVLSDDSHF
jgi:prepilin-type N-terminal cleavage/methylation domain-containing protein